LKKVKSLDIQDLLGILIKVRNVIIYIFRIKDASGNRISPYQLLEQYINLDESGLETSSKQDGVTPSSEW